MLIPFGVLSAAAGGAPAGASDYELIESYILGSAQSSVTFSSLGDYSSTYKHLQIRWVARSDRGSGAASFWFRFNGDTGSNYANHALYGDTSVVSFGQTSQNRALITSVLPASGATANVYSSGVMDVLDWTATKNKTVRTLAGYSLSPGIVQLASGLWMNTGAVTSISLIEGDSSNFVAGSRFSIYGIKG
jgi:hypothetical protein